jgi:hypothetical protein
MDDLRNTLTGTGCPYTRHDAGVFGAQPGGL